MDEPIVVKTVSNKSELTEKLRDNEGSVSKSLSLQDGDNNITIIRMIIIVAERVIVDIFFI